MQRADLHIHTTASDGVYTPSKVVLRAEEKGVQLLSVTDHDTLSGIAEAQKLSNERGIAFLPGVELSAGGEAEVHVLGYGVNEKDARLNTFLDEMRQEREDRARRMLTLLEKLGMPLDADTLRTRPQDAIGRPKIARAMIEKGYVKSVQEAFERYLGNGCPAYVPRRRVPVSEAVSLLRSVKAVPVLAHPCQIKLPHAERMREVEKWLDAGLRGIEIYHPSMSSEDRSFWLSYAVRHNLLVTGGSDFHALFDKHADIGEMIPYWKNSSEDIARLLDAVRTAGNNN